MDKSKDFLGTEPIGKLLMRLAVPTLTAQIINMLYNVVDRIYLGHIPKVGSLALTGVGICMPIIMIVTAFAALVSSGGAPRASIFMGRKRNNEAEKILGNCFTTQIVISLLLTAVLLIWNEPLLLAFGGDEATIGYATDYMAVYAIGTIFVQLTLGMNAFITAQGFTRTSMLSVLIGAGANIILDPILIFGFHMGVKGAALATILSQAMSTLWVLLFLFGKKTVLKIRPQYMRPEAHVILPCLALGMAPFIMQASESVIAVCFNTSLRDYGGTIAVGTMTILTSVMQFAMLPLQGIGQGAQPIISYNYGAGSEERVRAAFKLLLKVSMAFSMSIWLLVLFFPKMFIYMFNSEAPLLAFAPTPLRVYSLCMGIFGAQIACQMTFNALGNAKASITVAVMRKFILLLPLIYIMPHIMTGNKTMAVYTAEPIADFLSVVFTVVLFSHQFKKALASIHKPESQLAN